MSIPHFTPADQVSYEAALRTNRKVYFQFIETTLSHAVVAVLDPIHLDGQINIVGGDTNGITRTLQVGLLDPQHSLSFDDGSPSEGVNGMNRLIFVRTAVFCTDINRWLFAPAGAFRPSKVNRDGDTLTIEADGKECLHLIGVSPYTIAAKRGTVDAIRAILARQGETRFRFPVGNKHTLPNKVAVGGDNEDRQPWKVAWRLARSIGYQLYYDLDGACCLRVIPASPSWRSIEQGPGANLLTRASTSTDLTTIRNRVVATGRTKAHGKTKEANIVVIVGAAAANSFSSTALQMNGQPWSNTAFYPVPDLHTRADVTAFANARLAELLTESIDATYAMVPVWHLLPMDYMRLESVKGTINHRLKDSSMPLGASPDGQTVGWQQRVRSPRAGRLRR